MSHDTKTSKKGDIIKVPSPVGHMLSGIIIASASGYDNKPILKKLAWGAFFAAAPDLDMLFVFAGIDYIYAHRTFTHSLVIVVLVALCLKVMNLLINAFSKNNQIPWKLISICLFSHIFLDMLGKDEYGPKGLMIFWPLSNDFYYMNVDLFYGLMDTKGNPLSLDRIVLAVSWEVGLIGFVGAMYFMFYYFIKKRLESIQ